MSIKRVVPISIVWKPHPEKPAHDTMCCITWVYSNAPQARHETVAYTVDEVHAALERLAILDKQEVIAEQRNEALRVAGVAK